MISPGIEISLEALAARAARLPRVDIEEPRHAIGKGTKEAIQSGVVYGFAGQVDGIVGRLREELGEEATTIATGGYAAAIVPFCDQVDEVDDLLTLTGLKLIWERNRQPRPLPFPRAMPALTEPWTLGGRRSRTGSCSPRWPASATGSCGFRRAASGPASSPRRWSPASGSRTATSAPSRSSCASIPTSTRSRSSCSATTPT